MLTHHQLAGYSQDIIRFLQKEQDARATKRTYLEDQIKQLEAESVSADRAIKRASSLNNTAICPRCHIFENREFALRSADKIDDIRCSSECGFRSDQLSEK